MLIPIVIYYLVMVIKQHDSYSVISLFISLLILWELNSIFLGHVAIKSKKDVIEDYIKNHSDSEFTEYDIRDYAEKKVLDGIMEWPASHGVKNWKTSDNLQVHIYAVQPLQPNSKRSKNLAAYSTPTGIYNIGCFIFIRDEPRKSPKFGLYHEIGHLTWDNSIQYQEPYAYYLPFIFTLLWLLISINNSIPAFLLLATLCISSVFIIFEAFKIKKTSKVRSEIRADAFAIRYIDESEKSALLRLINKYNYPHDDNLTPEENAERRENLRKNIHRYSSEFDSFYADDIATQDTEWRTSLPRIVFMIATAILPFFSKEITTSLLIIYIILILALSIYTYYIIKKHHSLYSKVLSKIMTINMANDIERYVRQTASQDKK